MLFLVVIWCVAFLSIHLTIGIALVTLLMLAAMATKGDVEIAEVAGIVILWPLFLASLIFFGGQKIVRKVKARFRKDPQGELAL